ncbi:dynein heavy chain 5 axonemal, partial [Clonorchis sinensis]
MELSDVPSYTSDDNVTLHNKFGPLHERICHLVSERFRISQELAQECMLSENCMESVNLFLNSREDDNALAVYSVTGNMKKSYTEVAYGTPSDAYGADSSLFFMKSRSSETLSRENFNKYVSCFMLQKDENNLKSLHFLISTLYLPLLIQQKSYLGELLPQHKRDFIIEVKDYVHALNCSVACLAEKVTLATCREINLGSARDHSRCLELSQNLSTLGIVEECASRWMQQISLELREVNLVREELDTDGPHTEIHFWKCRMTRLNSLIDQLKRPDVANVSKILKLAQSKTLEAWSDLEKQIQVAYKEARENSKFLQSVKKHCDPLYRCQIPEMKLTVLNLIKVLRLICSYSTHYRTFTNMTILFTKITNQMVKGCVDYLTEKGTSSIWNQPVEVILTRLNDCIALNEAYHAAYHKISSESAE